MIPILAPPVTDWWCPNCSFRDQTKVAGPHIRYHICPGLRYLSAPMVQIGTKARVVLREREDYVGVEDVQFDSTGRPVMAIDTIRDDGSNDVAVFAPTAHVTGKALGMSNNVAVGAQIARGTGEALS
jgi:hypothetical protein